MKLVPLITVISFPVAKFVPPVMKAVVAVVKAVALAPVIVNSSNSTPVTLIVSPTTEAIEPPVMSYVTPVE